jgi:hypothetical protein
VEWGSSGPDERREAGVPPVIGSPRAVPAASATRLDRRDWTRNVGHWPYGHSSGGTRMVRENAFVWCMEAVEDR